MTEILTIPAADYHADDIADTPSLSASIASILCAQSPAHARAAHPRLNPASVRKEKWEFDRGTVAHSLVLEGRANIELLHHGNYQTKAAQTERDEARAAGRIPVLVHQLAEVEEMVAAVAAQLEQHEADPVPFTGGLPEQTLVWEENGVVCRARLDWLHDGNAYVSDLKTTSRSANPDAYSRALYSVGGDVQAAMYLRGVKAVTGVDAEFRWVVIETAPPYALSVISPGPDILALGDAKCDYAINLWRECLRLNEWPAYSSRVCYADLPGYEETRWLEKTTREEAA